jgi:pilus assembly protein Flp/PilA
MKKVMTLLKSQKGQGLVEYGILVALIALVSIIVVTTLGTNVRDAFQAIVDNFNVTPGGGGAGAGG